MLPIVTGPSLGANQAAITFLRRPELFSGLIALSGVYNSDYFFHGWCDENLYKNSPERFLENMPADHLNVIITEKIKEKMVTFPYFMDGSVTQNKSGNG